jgi:uncharacterized membrane protein
MPVTRTFLAVLAGLVLGTGLHIVIVVLVPSFAVRDAWSTTALLGPDGAFHVLPRPGPSDDPRFRDPNLVEAVCRFSIENQPVRITARLPDGFWSAAILDRAGRNLYSLNDTAGEKSGLDLVIRTPAQSAASSETPLPATGAIIAELSIDAGMIVLRVFVPDEAARDAAAAALNAADCNAPI